MPNKLIFRIVAGTLLALTIVSSLQAQQLTMAPGTTLPAPPAAPPVNALSGAITAYGEGKFQQAADMFKPEEGANGVAAGVVCELFVRKLLPPDDERGSAACEYATKAGDPNGLVWRALAGRNGYATLGIAVTETASLGYLAQAAEMDYAPAQGQLCEHFYTRKNFQQALPFCKYAGGRGIADALYYFAQMTLEGKGVVQDFRKGTDILLLSAQLRSALALTKLAELSRDGATGIPKNPVKAYAWILLASSADPNSKTIAAEKQALARNLSESKIAAAQANAAAWPLVRPSSRRDLAP